MLLILVAVCLAPSCVKIDSQDPDAREDVFVPVDSSSFTVLFNVCDNSSDTLRPIRRLDVFAYDADGIHSLVISRHYTFLPDSLLLYGPASGLTVVAIANSPLEFNMDALDRYDSMELLTFSFGDDSPSAPLMSGCGSVGANRSVRITLTPLLARVALGEVSNELGNYVRLEDPRICLDNANATAELLRTGGFYPSETVSTQKISLPYDIGIYPQNPGTELFCFPNDSEGSNLGMATVLVFECEIRGVTRRFQVPLPSIRRNSTITVDITVNAAEQLESKIY